MSYLISINQKQPEEREERGSDVMTKKTKTKTKTFHIVRESRSGDTESWNVKATSGHAAFKKLSPWGSGWKKGYKAYPITRRKKK